MRFEHNKKYTTIAIYALLVLLSAMICFEAFQNLGIVSLWLKKLMSYLQPFINGLVFAFLLNPLLRTIEGRLLPRLSRGRLSAVRLRIIALIATYLVAFSTLTLFIALVLPQIVLSLTGLAGNLQSYFTLLEDLYASVVTFLNAGNHGAETRVLAINLASLALESMENFLVSTTNYFSSIMMSLLATAQKFITGVINLFLGIIVSIYLLMDRERLFAQLRKIMYAVFSDRACDLIIDVGKDSNRILGGFVVGKIIDSLIIGILCFFGMSILQMHDYAMLISVIVGVTNVIPYFGPFIGAIPSAIILLVQSPMQTLWFLIFIFALQQFDGNILGPKILGDSIGLSPLWIMFSIILFSGLMGVAGMFIGVPLFAIIYSLFKRLVNFLLDRKGKSINTRDYQSQKNQLIK